MSAGTTPAPTGAPKIGVRRSPRVAIAVAVLVAAVAGYWWWSDFPERFKLPLAQAVKGHEPTTNKTGTFAINPQFDRAPGAFSEGLAAVQVGGENAGTYGYIDKTGKLVIAPQFDWAREFSDGLAQIRMAGRDGYIDKSGKIVVLPSFENSGAFHDGMAIVATHYGAKGIGIIDKTGRIIASGLDGAAKFSEGLAQFQVVDAQEAGNQSISVDYMIQMAADHLSPKGRFGYIDKTGKVVIGATFYEAGQFSEGLATVRIGEAAQYGYIDRTGAVVIPPQFAWAEAFSKGFAVVHLGGRGGQYSQPTRSTFVDENGKIMMGEFDFVGEGFSEDLAVVSVGRSPAAKFGYIDRTGKMVVTPQFSEARGFSEGLACIRIGDDRTGKDGFIDKSGRIVIVPQFDRAGSFVDGLAWVRVSSTWSTIAPPEGSRTYDSATGTWQPSPPQHVVTGKFGYIDKTGKLVVNPQFDYASDFADGLALVRIGDDKTGKYGYIQR